jgi:hypothetical protein
MQLDEVREMVRVASVFETLSYRMSEPEPSPHESRTADERRSDHDHEEQVEKEIQVAKETS